MKNIKPLQEILTAINRIKANDISTYDILKTDLTKQESVLYNLIVIGEAADRINVAFQEDHPEIPWSKIIGTRHVIAHGYDTIKLPIIWDMINIDIQKLEEQISKLL